MYTYEGTRHGFHNNSTVRYNEAASNPGRRPERGRSVLWQRAGHERRCENPINAYAFSKLVFDQYVRHVRADLRAPVVGLRYFNVYGPGEAHKGGMASVIYHFHRQLLLSGTGLTGQEKRMRKSITLQPLSEFLTHRGQPYLGHWLNLLSSADLICDHT